MTNDIFIIVVVFKYIFQNSLMDHEQLNARYQFSASINYFLN